MSVFDTLTMYGFHIAMTQWSLMLLKVTAHIHIVLITEVYGNLPQGMVWW
jgi:hypothetical protein